MLKVKGNDARKEGYGLMTMWVECHGLITGMLLFIASADDQYQYLLILRLNTSEMKTQ